MVVIFIISLIILIILIVSLLSVKKTSKKENKAPSPIITKTIYFKEEVKDIELAKDLLESVVGIRVCEVSSLHAKIMIVNKDIINKDTEIKKSLRKGNIELK